jgi:tellurite resistance protein TerC
MHPSPASWIVFTGGVVILLLLDLLLLRRKGRTPFLFQSAATTLGWIALAGAFGLWIWHRGGPARGLEFLTGYLIEYTLSMDNIFIFVLVFASFRIPAGQQHRLLFWGVLGALVMRGLLVGAGAALLGHFQWVIYLFGAYIVYAGVTMLFQQKKKVEIEKKWVVRAARRFLPMSAENESPRFVVREGGRLKFTLLFLVLVIIEATDLVFALDSVPAVFGVTRDPFIVYTSNICALLGLRSLYFLLAGAIQKLTYLHIGLAGVLIFIGAKMLGERFYSLPTETSLLIVGAILGLTVLASLLKTRLRTIRLL